MRFWLVLLLLVGSGVAWGEDPTKLAKPTSYVSDLAGVLDESSKAQLESLCKQVFDKTQSTIEVVTVQSLDGDDIDDFTVKLEENWKVGAKGTETGLIFLVAMKEHKDRIEVGYGLEGILNDAKVGDIRRSMHDQFVAGEYGPALLGGVRQVANVIAADKGVTLTQDQGQEPGPQPQYHRVHQQSPIGTILRIGFFLFVLFMIFRGGGRNGRGGGGGSGLGWFLLGNMLGGSGGGRSNWGGGSDSGGGGNFGGGFGGGSGGGGASGDW